MTRNIQRNDFIDLFRNQSIVVDDVTRRNANVLVTDPSRDLAGEPVDRTIVVDTPAPAWFSIGVLTQTLAVYGSPIEMRVRMNVSSITANTILNLSFAIDGAEVTGNRYGLAQIDSLNFSPALEFSHIVTGVPASTHSFTLMGNIQPRTGSSTAGLSATLTQGIRERMIITEVK